jgi:aspartate carbamoyltransferase catalytic subunit
MLYGLTMEKLEQLRKKIIILHPGPINRGVEITSAVADSDQAIILDQVENGVAIRMAIIYLLAAKLNITAQ